MLQLHKKPRAMKSDVKKELNLGHGYFFTKRTSYEVKSKMCIIT